MWSVHEGFNVGRMFANMWNKPMFWNIKRPKSKKWKKNNERKHKGLHVQWTMSKSHGRNYLCQFPFLVNDNKDVDVNALKPCDVLFIIIV